MINRHLLLVSLLATLMTAGAVDGQTGQQPTAEDMTVLNAVEIAGQLGRQFGDSIWSGYDLSRMPFISYIPDQWALLVNAPDSVVGFSEYPAGWPKLRSHFLYHAGQLGDLAGQLAFDVQIGSAHVAAVGYYGQNARKFLELLVHENFHQYQYNSFGDIPWEREELYPTEDAGNTALASLEAMLLRDATERIDRGEGELWRHRLAQFVAVRLHRWKEADPYVARYEQGQELNEGTAKYVEIRSIDLIPGLRYSPALAGPADVLSADSMPLGIKESLLLSLDHMTSTGVIAPEDMPRNRIYPVGSAQGFFLDQLGVDWKPVAQKGGPDFTYVGLMAAALELDSTRLPSLEAEAEREFDFDSTLKLAHRSIDAYRRGYDSVLSLFDSQPGVRVELSFSGKSLTRSRNSGARKWMVENGSKEFRDHYDIYSLHSTSGSEFGFQLKNSGVLEVTDWSTKDKKLVFYCGSFPPILLDGSPFTTVAGERSFDQIQIKGEDVALTANRSGSVSVGENSLTIRIAE